jgi:hypothetical protein
MNGTKLTGLWKNKSKKGNSYLAGNLGFARILILPNNYKEKETDPDFNLWVVPKENSEKSKEEGEEDIPF